MDFIAQLFPDMGQTQIMVQMTIFIVNILLFLFAKPILMMIDPVGATDPKIRLFRAVNIFVFGLQLIGLFMLWANLGPAGGIEIVDGVEQELKTSSNFLRNMGYSIMAIYGMMLLYSFLGAQIKKRFGKERTLDSKKVYMETYSSRLVNLIMLLIMILTVIYILIIIWGAQDKFTPIYGLLAAFLGFTSGIWAPDIISGLIILNTEILEDGDVVMLDGHENEYVIGRVTLIYVVLYDIRNNHRTLMRNAQFTQNRIDNLSRVTSSNGIRQGLLYKIGYPAFSGNREERVAQLAEFKDSISDMFTAANEVCIADENIMINESKPFDWALTNAGDFALEYTLWVYLERIPNTKITSTIRKHLMGTIYKVNEAVYEASIAENIDLSTPNVQQILMPSEIPEQAVNIPQNHSKERPAHKDQSSKKMA